MEDNTYTEYMKTTRDYGSNTNNCNTNNCNTNDCNTNNYNLNNCNTYGCNTDNCDTDNCTDSCITYRKKQQDIERAYPVNTLFTMENVKKIHVPDIVEEDLLNIIEEKLRRAGFYYRIAYRVKAADSLLEKIIFKDYQRAGTENEDKKLQDLIGIRIMLYFEDDVQICRDLLDTLFVEPGKWVTTENNEYEFKAMKVNGIFPLPSYLAKAIVNPMLHEYVDDTFEVQVRTNSFEGWHEIEHDLRYKGSAFGEGNESLARKMNSILATYELCDDSIVSLLEDLGHQHYKKGKWGDMIRCHYRLKFNNEMLCQELVNVFDSDIELAKKFFKFKRAKAIAKLWNNTQDKVPELSVNYIVRIVNEIEVQDERLNDAFAMIDGRRKPIENVMKRKKFEPFKTLGTYKVFNADTYLDNSYYEDEECFRRAANYIYAWIKSRYSEALEALPETVGRYIGAQPGYSVEIIYDEKTMFFEELSTHIDSKVASRIWISRAILQKTPNGIRFKVSNEYAEPKDRYRDTENILFSRPNFYGEIADNIGLRDVCRLRESLSYVELGSYNTMVSLIESQERKFPVIVFMGNDGEWMERFDANYFAYLVGYYAHIRVIDIPELEKQFAVQYGLNMQYYEDSITVFYPDGEQKTSYKSDIMDTTFEVIKLEQKKYWNENGCRAYRRQLVAEIRESNVR